MLKNVKSRTCFKEENNIFIVRFFRNFTLYNTVRRLCKIPLIHLKDEEERKEVLWPNVFYS